VCDNTVAISAPPRIGYISSPDYPRSYPANVSCDLLVAGTDSDKVKTDLLDLEVEARSKSDCYDYLTLKVYDLTILTIVFTMLSPT